MNTITLNRSAAGWMATYAGPYAAVIRSLFGTVTVPTAFTSDALPEEVLAQVQGSNPNFQVVVYL